jgi:hypothetical protein
MQQQKIYEIIDPSLNEKLYFVYLLKLEKNKYYVGKAYDYKKRYEDHQKGSSVWTKKYKPIKILKLYKTNQPFLELSKFLEYANFYGIENVRGDIYSREVLSYNDIYHIEKSMRHQKGSCLCCGSFDHFISSCPKKRRFIELEIYLQKIETIFSQINIPFEKLFLRNEEIEENKDMLSSILSFPILKYVMNIIDPLKR